VLELGDRLVDGGKLVRARHPAHEAFPVGLKDHLATLPVGRSGGRLMGEVHPGATHIVVEPLETTDLVVHRGLNSGGDVGVTATDDDFHARKVGRSSGGSVAVWFHIGGGGHPPTASAYWGITNGGGSLATMASARMRTATSESSWVRM
jgi:hypothetical protein